MTQWRLLTLLYVVTVTGLAHGTPPAHRKIQTVTPGTSKPGVRLSPPTSAAVPPLPLLQPPSTRPAPLPARASPPDVSVTCSTSDVVVRVRAAFYGFGADAAELRLGSSCTSTGVLRPYGDLLFAYPLTACDSRRELSGGDLLYRFTLHYEPSPRRLPSPAHRLQVGIECRYHRTHYVSQLAVKPTWQTAVVRKRLKGGPSDFRVELLDESWSRPAEPQVFLLGQTLHLQVSAPHLPAGGKVYISSCSASPATGSSSSLKYTIIGKSGCLLDSRRHPGASQFISRTDKELRFTLKAFQFISDPDAEITIHCKLLVSAEEPGRAQKSCSYSGVRWKALVGADSVCDCCESQCVSVPQTHTVMMEGSASSGMLVSDQPYTEDDSFLPVSPSPVSIRREGRTTKNGQEDGKEGGGAGEEGFEEEDERFEDEGVVDMVLLGEEPDYETIVLRNIVEEGDSPEVREEGSGQVDDLWAREEEGVEKVNQGEVLRSWEQLEMLSQVGSWGEEPLGSEAEEGNRTEDPLRETASETQWRGGGGEQTWYFTWR